jgi:hypothetical protein
MRTSQSAPRSLAQPHKVALQQVQAVQGDVSDPSGEMSMKRNDWLLLAVAAAKDDGLDPVQLQKSLFLLSEKRRDVGTKFHEFEPHNYGPFSKEIYTDGSCSRRLSHQGKTAGIFVVRLQGHGRGAGRGDESPLGGSRRIPGLFGTCSRLGKEPDLLRAGPVGLQTLPRVPR